MEIPHPERWSADRDELLHAPSLYLLFMQSQALASLLQRGCTLGPEAEGPLSQGTDRSSVGWSEIQGICSQCSTTRFRIVYLSADLSKHRDTRWSGASRLLGKYILDHCAQFFHPRSLSKLCTMAFIASQFKKMSWRPTKWCGHSLKPPLT